MSEVEELDMCEDHRSLTGGFILVTLQSCQLRHHQTQPPGTMVDGGESLADIS